MFCPTCQTRLPETVIGIFNFSESGLDNVYLQNWPGFRCDKCNIQMPLLPDAEKITKYIAKQLLKKSGPLVGTELRFLRMAADFKAEELALCIEIEPERLIRAENDRQPLTWLQEATFRQMVAAVLFVNDPDTFYELDDHQTNTKLPRKPLKIEILNWFVSS